MTLPLPLPLHICFTAKINLRVRKVEENRKIISAYEDFAARKIAYFVKFAGKVRKEKKEMETGDHETVSPQHSYLQKQVHNQRCVRAATCLQSHVRRFLARRVWIKSGAYKFVVETLQARGYLYQESSVTSDSNEEQVGSYKTQRKHDPHHHAGRKHRHKHKSRSSDQQTGQNGKKSSDDSEIECLSSNNNDVMAMVRAEAQAKAEADFKSKAEHGLLTESDVMRLLGFDCLSPDAVEANEKWVVKAERERQEDKEWEAMVRAEAQAKAEAEARAQAEAEARAQAEAEAQAKAEADFKSKAEHGLLTESDVMRLLGFDCLSPDAVEANEKWAVKAERERQKDKEWETLVALARATVEAEESMKKPLTEHAFLELLGFGFSSLDEALGEYEVWDRKAMDDVIEMEKWRISRKRLYRRSSAVRFLIRMFPHLVFVCSGSWVSFSDPENDEHSTVILEYCVCMYICMHTRTYVHL